MACQNFTERSSYGIKVVQQPLAARLIYTGTNSRSAGCRYSSIDLSYQRTIEDMRYTIEEIQQMPEGQTFDCKSIHIEPKHLPPSLLLWLMRMVG